MVMDLDYDVFLVRLNHVVFVVYWDYVSSFHGCFYDDVDENFCCHHCFHHCHHNDGCFCIYHYDDICVKVIVIENGIFVVMEIVDVVDPL